MQFSFGKGAFNTNLNTLSYILRRIDVEEILFEIQKYLLNKYGEAVAHKVKILYGGSVNADNAKSYLDISLCDGLLVGGASLNYKEFSKICQL